MGPVDEVFRLHHHNPRIVLPPELASIHVGSHDIIASVLAAQNVWVAYTAARADGVACNNRLVAVQRIPVLCVVAESEAQVFLTVAGAFEIGEEISGEFIVCSFLCGSVYIRRAAESKCCKKSSNEWLMFHVSVVSSFIMCKIMVLYIV